MWYGGLSRNAELISEIIPERDAEFGGGAHRCREMRWTLDIPLKTGAGHIRSVLLGSFDRDKQTFAPGIRDGRYRPMIEDMTVRNLSPTTQRSYVHAVAKCCFFGCSPASFGDVRSLLFGSAERLYGMARPSPPAQVLRQDQRRGPMTKTPIAVLGIDLGKNSCSLAGLARQLLQDLRDEWMDQDRRIKAYDDELMA